MSYIEKILKNIISDAVLTLNVVVIEMQLLWERASYVEVTIYPSLLSEQAKTRLTQIQKYSKPVD